LHQFVFDAAGGAWATKKGDLDEVVLVEGGKEGRKEGGREGRKEGQGEETDVACLSNPDCWWDDERRKESRRGRMEKRRKTGARFVKKNLPLHSHSRCRPPSAAVASPR
jgi:hypothetical protein